ncbi:hypothetical protein IWQ47_001578 [Aquimarina sp. EL_43]|uniref:hypothetical protein n=1 Tax=Aquimarina TaxID=290174 RepID=UPI00046FD920|nr:MULTISPECIES: hypothetical protein [Aquimarina]MBG6130339.1 hypothetical protein [Aquimarina sp. EL_35]MBG6149119.1 hypothetical protein [Aquimarina sp. EL_32]MBG6168507.1 hypothetical protein [Aquimarina sp. EL_43]
MNSRDRYTEIINGMKSDDKQVQWNIMVEWCILWIEVEKKELKPLLEFIKECKEIGFWKRYYPSQSHYALGLSLGKNYDKRYDLPMVYIRYNSDKNNFDIQYQKGQGGETTRVDCGSKISESDFKSIAHWLDNKKNNRQEP